MVHVYMYIHVHVCYKISNHMLVKTGAIKGCGYIERGRPWSPSLS